MASRSKRMRIICLLRRAGLGALALVLLVTLGTTATAAAHAELLSTSPSSGAVLAEPPRQVVLTFDQAVDTVPDSIRVVAADGTAVDVGKIRQDLGADTIAADVPQLANGSYVVAWKAVSSDSHPIAGAFTFAVGAPSATRPGLVQDLLDQNAPARPGEVWLAIGRWASYLGVAVLLGTALALARLDPRQLRTRRAGAVLLSAAVVALLGTVLMIGAQASVTLDDAFAWREVVRTRSGRWWGVRVVLVAGALVAVLVRRRMRRTTPWIAAATAGSIALLGIVAAGGHGITGRWVAIGFAATVAHLAAMAVWIGGLAGLAFVLPRRRLARAAYLFSPLAFGAVAVLAVTGTLNAWRQSSSITDLRHSNYGTWLVIKLVLLAAVLAIAAASRWLVRLPTTDDTARSLRRSVRAEVVGILVVMVATAGLVNSSPPRSAFALSSSVNVVVGSRIADLTLSPPVKGGTTMHVNVGTAGGSLLAPTSITVTAALASRNIGPLQIPTVADTPSHVTADNANLPLAGEWTFTITAKYSEFDQTVFVATLKVA